MGRFGAREREQERSDGVCCSDETALQSPGQPTPVAEVEEGVEEVEKAAQLSGRLGLRRERQPHRPRGGEGDGPAGIGDHRI